MQLKSLLTATPVLQITGDDDREVTSLAYDSRRVTPGTLFIALRGERSDGHEFVDQAIAKGAVAVVVDQPSVLQKATTVQVVNTRAAMADLAAAFFRNPSKPLKVAGITGTNGKTTTAFLLKHILDSAQLRAGLIGTVRYEIGDRQIPATRTTPESLDLQDLLYQIRSAGCKAAVMEVSSHALMQDRVRGVAFDVGVFTNLTQDHLDYHRTMEGYFEAKARLFTEMTDSRKEPGAAINIDDRWGPKMIKEVPGNVKILTFGQGMKANFRASNITIDFKGTSYQLDANGKHYLVRLPLIGRFNVYNSLGAIAAAHLIGVDVRSAVLSLANAPFVPGRLEAVPVKRQFRTFVDYAHTDDALTNVMKTLRELSPNRLIVVFGCGGSRDRAKRPLMGRAVEEHADWAIVTSDNPRKESPGDIIADIERGMPRGNYEVVIDRREAIERAIAMASARDIVLLAGKGHETYQEFADHTVPFDDLQVAKEAMEAYVAEDMR